ncbi:MAG: glycosyltransferase, partial [Pseudomonadota bacterium]
DEAAAAHGLAGRIDWRGKQDQRAVIEAMRAADLFVLPSRIADDGDRDGLPNVLMEAASQRLPIVSTAVSAIPEFIRDGEEGTLVPPGDAAALAAAIARLAGDETLAERFGTAAYRRLLAEFGMAAGIETIASRLNAALTATEATVAASPKPAAAKGGSEAMASERA